MLCTEWGGQGWYNRWVLALHGQVSMVSAVLIWRHIALCGSQQGFMIYQISFWFSWNLNLRVFSSWKKMLFPHISDFSSCWEQLWDKSIPHGFHDLQICAMINTSWGVKYARKCILYGFPCEKDFLWIPLSLQATRVGITVLYYEKSISHGKLYKIHIMASIRVRYGLSECHLNLCHILMDNICYVLRWKMLVLSVCYVCIMWFVCDTVKPVMRGHLNKCPYVTGVPSSQVHFNV